MSQNARTTQATLEDLRLNLEKEKLIATEELLRKTGEFLAFDSSFNNKLLELLDVLVEAGKKSPGAVFRSDSSNIAEVVDALIKKRSEGGSEGSPGVTGGDVVGADWIDDLGRIVSALTSVVKEEKAFFLQIIRLIFCGC
ncbi:MAG: hypothetical protein HY704_06945 [Gemmatimonadetes bacterium]|nr:hypothetical protein [Gemmatimonadota bacterium]